MSGKHIRGNLVFKGTYEHTIAGDVTAAMLLNKSCLLCNKTSGAATAVALPAMQYVGQGLIVVDAKGDAATNAITITPASGNINGSATYVISENYGSICLIWDGTNFTAFALSNPVSAAELAFLNGITAGTGLASKALVLSASGHVAMPAAGHLRPSVGTAAAAGTDATNATALTEQVTYVTASDGVKGVALPAAATTLGPMTVINTVATGSLLVYPVNGGNDQINGLAEDLAIEIGPGESAVFVPVSATQWYVEVPHNLFNHELVTATNIITAFENGKTYYLNAAGGFTSTLPAPFKGAAFRFVVKTAPTTAYIIVTTSGANLMYGMMLERAGGAGVAGAARDTFNFVANQAIIGDWVEFFSDGTNWYYRGMVDVAAGNTVAQT